MQEIKTYAARIIASQCGDCLQVREVKSSEQRYVRGAQMEKTGIAGRDKNNVRIAVKGKDKVSREEWLKEDLFVRLSRSAFRSRFHLSEKDRQYVRTKGMDTIRSHAQDFVSKRLAPAIIPNDGKQTPMRGHPVFIAQHATACCCRGCLYKWHNIPAGRALTEKEQEYVVDILMKWIEGQMKTD